MTLHVRCTSNSCQRSIIVKRQATMRSSPPLNIFKPLVLNQVRGIQELLWPAQIGFPVLAFWALHINGRSRSMRHVHNENVVFHLGIEERPMHRDLTCVGCPVLGQTWPIARQCWHELLLTIGWVIGPLKHPLVDVSMSTTRIFIIGMSVIQVVHVDSTGQTTTKYCCLCMKDPLAGPLWVTNHTSHSSPIALRSNTTLIPWLQIIWTDPSTSTCCTARARPYNTTTRHQRHPQTWSKNPCSSSSGGKNIL